jgi:hypothetical protein
MPRTDYEDLISGGPKPYGERGMHYHLPQHLQHENEDDPPPSSTKRGIRPLVAVVLESKVFVVDDHQAFTTIRLGKMERDVKREDLTPDSLVSLAVSLDVHLVIYANFLDMGLCSQLRHGTRLASRNVTVSRKLYTMGRTSNSMLDFSGSSRPGLFQWPRQMASIRSSLSLSIRTALAYYLGDIEQQASKSFPEHSNLVSRSLRSMSLHIHTFSTSLLYYCIVFCWTICFC